MAQFDWPLQSSKVLNIRQYTKADYDTAKAIEKPDRRPRVRQFAQVVLELQYHCERSDRERVILEDSSWSAVHDTSEPLSVQAPNHTTENTRTDIGLPTPTSEVRSTIASSVCREVPCDELKHSADVTAAEVNDVDYITTYDLVGQLLENAEAALSVAGSGTRVWTPSAKELLLQLKDDAQLTWHEIELYFPGRTKGSLSQQYLRTKKQSRPVAEEELVSEGTKRAAKTGLGDGRVKCLRASMRTHKVSMKPKKINVQLESRRSTHTREPATPSKRHQPGSSQESSTSRYGRHRRQKVCDPRDGYQGYLGKNCRNAASPMPNG